MPIRQAILGYPLSGLSPGLLCPVEFTLREGENAYGRKGIGIARSGRHRRPELGMGTADVVENAAVRARGRRVLPALDPTSFWRRRFVHRRSTQRYRPARTSDLDPVQAQPRGLCFGSWGLTATNRGPDSVQSSLVILFEAVFNRAQLTRVFLRSRTLQGPRCLERKTAGIKEVTHARNA